MMTFEISTDLGPILILILKIEIKNLGEVDIFKNLKDSRKKILRMIFDFEEVEMF